MKSNYVLFKWLAGQKEEFISHRTWHSLLLMRTGFYDVSVHRWEAAIYEDGCVHFRGEEAIWLRDRESGEKKGTVYDYYGGQSFIEKLIESKNRDRDLWKLEMSIDSNKYD